MTRLAIAFLCRDTAIGLARQISVYSRESRSVHQGSQFENKVNFMVVLSTIASLQLDWWEFGIKNKGQIHKGNLDYVS